MFDFVNRRLSVKLSLFLAGLVVPALAIATLLVTARESQVQDELVRIVSEQESKAVEDLILQKAKGIALAGAAAYGVILEEAVDSKALTIEEIITPILEEARFVDATGRPLKIEVKRYNSKLADYTDMHGIGEIQDRSLVSSDILFASGMASTDKGGYVPTPHLKYSEPPKGCPTGATEQVCQANYKRDRDVSRKRRVYPGDEQKRAAAFEGAGINSTLVQPYPRDTGEQAWDVAAPITVKGRHFGAFRVGIARDQIAARNRDLISVTRDQIQSRHRELVIGLCMLFGVMAIVLVFGIFWMAWRCISPLTILSNQVDRMSMDNSPDLAELRTKLRPSSRDEIGRMTASCERLRMSTVAAMTHLTGTRPQ